MNRAILLLAGGAGTRLWPLSSDDRPKQFLRIFGGQSLLRRTFDRVRRLIPAEAIFVSTNERYRAQCLAELPELPAGNVITEPSRRNTAPAIALACAELAASRGDDVAIAVLASDHFIADEAEFIRILDKAFAFAESRESLVCIGITPTEPHTGYGYLELDRELEPGVMALRRIVEKPDRERAEAFLRSGNFVWNAGMFVWRYGVFLAELRRAAPELAAVTRESYEEAPSISIDYALMERAREVAAVPGEFGWYDVGNWAAVARLAKEGSAHLITREANGVFAETSAGRPVVVIGVDDIAIIESEHGLLVMNLAKAELLSDVVKKLP